MKPTILLSPSALESYRIWYDDVFMMTEQELVERLSKSSPPNINMAIGTATHSLIENGFTPYYIIK